MTETVYSPDLSVGHLFSRAWETFKEHLGFMVAVFLIYSLITGSGNIFGSGDGVNALAQIIIFVISGPMLAGAYAVSLRVLRGAEPDLGVLFSGFQEFGRAFGVFALYSLMVIVGFLLLLVPGIYMAVALAPAMFLVMEDRLGVADTLRKAWAMTEGFRGRIFVVSLAVIGINILGLLALVVGIIFTGALSLLIGAALYDELARAYEYREV